MNGAADGVLVIGATGFIGSAVTSSLARRGRRVHALGRSDPALAFPAGVAHVRGSIEDTGLLRETLAHCGAIVHAAGATTPGSSARDPAFEITANLLPLARVLECATMFPRRHLVFLSSGGAVYGDAARGAGEATPLRPRSYYGAGKAAAEALIHVCTATTDWSATVLRPTNPYGPGQTAARGFAIVPTLFERALDGDAFPVWGDGSSVRDYCYIDDLVEAVLAALEHRPPAGFGVYNVASGSTASVAELAAACERASGRRIRLEVQPARAVDVAHVSPDGRAIAAALGWRSRVGLEDGLARTWRWFGTASG